MVFELFLPYNMGASLDINDNMNGFYKDEQDYVDALVTEDSSNGGLVYRAMTRGDYGGSIYTNFNGRDFGKVKSSDTIVYAKGECILLTPDGRDYEDVDSMIDKFVSQREFLVMAHFDMKNIEGEFEEEIREWAKETLNILLAGKEIIKNGGTNADMNKFIDMNIPKRNMRLSFNNKSGKCVNFILNGCEIEKKIAKNRYLFYVKRMEMLK